MRVGSEEMEQFSVFSRLKDGVEVKPKPSDRCGDINLTGRSLQEERVGFPIFIDEL